MDNIRNSTNKKDLHFDLYNIDENEEDNNELSRGNSIKPPEDEEGQRNILNIRNSNNIIRNTTNFEENNNCEDTDDEALKVVEDSEEVAFIENEVQFKRTKSRVSFYEGRPKTEQDILKLECPLYRCSRNTIVTKQSKSTSNIYNLSSKNSNSNFDDSNQHRLSKLKKGFTHDSFVSVVAPSI